MTNSTPRLTTTMVAVALVWWPNYARLARSRVMAARQLDYVEAGRALGLSPTRIVLRHILPNILSSLMVQASLDVGSVILTAAGLAFIGFGAQPPLPEWGVMIDQGRDYLMNDQLVGADVSGSGDLRHRHGLQPGRGRDS